MKNKPIRFTTVIRLRNSNLHPEWNELIRRLLDRLEKAPIIVVRDNNILKIGKVEPHRASTRSR